MKPPLSPEETLRRVLRIAKFDGLSVVIIALLGSLLSLLLGDLVGVGVGLIVAFGGWTELNGRQRLLRGDGSGTGRLIRGQWIIMGAILVYCVSRVASFDSDTALGSLTPDLRKQLQDAGLDMAAILPLVRLMFYLMYTAVAAITIIYQGLMVLYYRRRAPAISRALAAPKAPAVPPVIRPGPDPEDLVT